MPNYTFDYYAMKRKIRVRTNGAIADGSFYVSLRLEKVLMEDPAFREALGFIKITDIPATDAGITIDREKTFHCASSKRLVGHISFTLKHTGPDATIYPKWGVEVQTSAAYSKTINFTDLEIFMNTHVFKPENGAYSYKLVPGTLKERRRKADA